MTNPTALRDLIARIEARTERRHTMTQPPETGKHWDNGTLFFYGMEIGEVVGEYDDAYGIKDPLPWRGTLFGAEYLEPKCATIEEARVVIERELDAFLSRAGLIERPKLPDDVAALDERLSDEADLCRNDGAVDVARLLDEARVTVTAQAAELDAVKAENAELREALVQHNDRLRSAIQIAQRDGRDTNWLTFRGQCHYTAAAYQDIVNAARAHLKGQAND